MKGRWIYSFSRHLDKRIDVFIDRDPLTCLMTEARYAHAVFVAHKHNGSAPTLPIRRFLSSHLR